MNLHVFTVEKIIKKAVRIGKLQFCIITYGMCMICRLLVKKVYRDYLNSSGNKNGANGWIRTSDLLITSEWTTLLPHLSSVYLNLHNR